MYNLLKTLTLALFLLTLNSCSDDSGTDPSDEFVGATFQFEDRISLDYETYRDGEVNDSVYELYISNGDHYGKKSYKYYFSDEKEELGTGDFGIVSIQEDGFFVYDIGGLEDYIPFFPEIKSQWLKYIDFKQERWTQFDLKLDSTFEQGGQADGHFKVSGEKVSDSKVEYKGKQHNTTLYRLEINAKIKIDEIEYKNIHRVLEITVIDNIGFYKTETYNFGEESYSYRILTDHK